jgi:hypothetical protein
MCTDGMSVKFANEIEVESHATHMSVDAYVAEYVLNS